ncbi:pentapeptide repeat-containing protein [Stenomitos frigidus]|uniref:Pentapeptide repeat-containing protein n=1 Tax=Stenomitos frigidus ULC18 TaxID=2107698 RepID=A0A2T1EBG1_9CYAN|nr:pentapeptide repeat-containing protein [Stenomitos frigidus]PSB30070.1 hypothetical protein C7B82_09885 [Stenomitos frigidus ULC18]
MKATEVLNRYANGERDFRHANIRGQSFKGQDLSGADFTEADIRGTNFTNAILKEVNFGGAKAGLEKRWLLVQLFIALLLSLLLGGLAGFPGALIAIFFHPDSVQKYTIAPGITMLSLIVVCFVTIIYRGLTFQTLSTIAAAVVIAFAFIGACAVSVSGSGVFAYVGAAAGVSAVVVILASASAAVVALTGASAVVSALTGASAVVVIFAYAKIGLSIFGSAFASALALVGASAFAGTGTLFSLYVNWQAFKGNEKFASIYTFGVAFSAIGGTSFCGADLTKANFTKAILKSTNFTKTWKKDAQGKRQASETILEWVCWHDAKRLDRTRIGTSILANPAVRELLVTRDGYKKSYVDAKLRNTNLNGANLEQADLTWADLTCAHMRQANLKDAKLIEALALGTDFTGATFTGACLEAWNIDSHTILEGVHCQYVYLLRNQQERRPSSGDFAPGEFTKLFQEALNTVDLIFRNGVDWKAFVAAFQTVQVDNDGTELTIQSIENKGDGVVVVRVSVPEGADKAKLHSEFNLNYDLAVKALEAKYYAELKAKDEQITIYREKSADMTEILRLLANRPVTVEVNASAESKAMNDSTDKSQSVNIGGNVTGSTLNLGAISGSVSNVVNQLPSAPDPAQPGIKELLIELQAAIESDADLPEKGKASALEHVKVLAEVAQDPEQPEKKGLGSQAITFLKGAASSLPDTAKLAEACTKLLPLITKALGLPF